MRSRFERHKRFQHHMPWLGAVRRVVRMPFNVPQDRSRILISRPLPVLAEDAPFRAQRLLAAPQQGSRSAGDAAASMKPPPDNAFRRRRPRRSTR
ncbi:hypothetical protein Xaut_0104 [Xanthobacter versatilis]|uniref:Uncharacterized protein n=1 Tax=Xanthobacter autotrophicus (strain ATCC BAA-1158 / Py2) TaxID=78245 RepID=A7IBH0_XANP2|nr:hypothetical protein Xaut_0104 [Xanthobacter autotrophicus Py2]